MAVRVPVTIRVQPIHFATRKLRDGRVRLQLKVGKARHNFTLCPCDLGPCTDKTRTACVRARSRKLKKRKRS